MQRIFLHGLGQTSASWEQTIRALPLQEQIHCPDLPGLLRGQEVFYETLYRSFCEYCSSFSEPLDLCGLSLGGILALHYSIEHPQRMHSLVLIGAQYQMPKRLLALQNVLFRFMPNSMFQQMGFQKSGFIRLSTSMSKLDFSADLMSVPCPVLVLCGEKDHANKAASVQLAQRLPRAELQIIQGAGHEVNVSAPQSLATLLYTFYQTL